MNKFLTVLLLCLLACSGKQDPENNKNSIDMDTQLERFESRRRYSGFTKEIFASIPDALLEQAVVDYVCDHVLGGDPAAKNEAFKKLSPGFRAVYSTIMLEEVVNSSGFAGYFHEPESIYIGDAVEGFRLLGAAASSRIALRAMVIARESGRQGSADDSLTRLDAEFAGSGEHTGELRIRYIRKNPPEFFTK